MWMMLVGCWVERVLVPGRRQSGGHDGGQRGEPIDKPASSRNLSSSNNRTSSRA